MKTEELLAVIKSGELVKELSSVLETYAEPKIEIKGLVGSYNSMLCSSIAQNSKQPQFVILNSEEEAAYFYNDLEALLGENKVFFYPKSTSFAWLEERQDNQQTLQRAEALNAINKRNDNYVIVSYPEAICEKILSKETLEKNTLSINVNEEYSIDFITEFLVEFDFEHVDFVHKPGQFSVRGSIVDIFSFSNEHPFRLDFFGDTVESIRSFDAADQLSIKNLVKVSIVPSINNTQVIEQRNPIFSFLTNKTILWVQDINLASDLIEKYQEELISQVPENINQGEFYLNSKLFKKSLTNQYVIQLEGTRFFEDAHYIKCNQKPQAAFKKNFNLLHKDLETNVKQGFKNLIFSHNAKQIERLYAIFEDLGKEAYFEPVYISIHEGFKDNDLKIACYTDHQIFERYHRYKLKEGYKKAQQAHSLKDLIDLQKGDYVTHINHGVGVFDGLQKIEMNGKKQEAIRLIFKENDLLYVNIHSLHKIAKYSSKEGRTPKLDKLGAKTWQALKQKTKNRVKTIAYDLIQLYAKRKVKEGFAFSPDTYLQNELEASFMYEDTPDQLKATIAVKADMEKPHPMDRLVCGDVGFGKTEIAIRAAFKAAVDGKQVAILAPTTILTLQHYQTIKKRLKDLPCTVDYLNRFKSAKQQKETIERLKEGKIDIIVGTHKIVGKSIKFKDLGLLIIDEEHKFGVGVKDKLKTFKVNVDTLTLTATPIPRTLQFSLMNARDLSIINTPPPNRQPVSTELHQFNEEIIKDSVYKEIARNGQVFFIHNRVKNIQEVADMIKRLCPEVKVAVGHGQMKPEELEKIILAFIDGDYDVLVATTIIESGLDIPNANTIIINNAHNFGLSDLHQMRGRVGRSNRKAYCHLLSPPLSTISSDARKRLKVIEQFSDLGSGFSISMRDLDIRGAGDLLGPDQSGFISEIGFETYQKILNEAIQELKETQFKDLFEKELAQNTDFVEECNLDTDLEIIIPDKYVNNVNERLSLYKELSTIKSELALNTFVKHLVDRFGDTPIQVKNLIESVKLKWLCKRLGFEKVVLKKDTLLLSFISNPDSRYYSSGIFAALMQKIQTLSIKPELKQKGDKLRLIVRGMNSIEKSMSFLQQLTDVLPKQK